MNMKRQRNAKQTKARIQPKPNKQMAESAQNSFAIRWKNKHLNTDLQINTPKRCAGVLYCTQGDHLWSHRHDI